MKQYMAMLDGKKAHAVSEVEIARLDTMLKSIDSDISVAMSYVRRAQGLSFKELESRFSGLNGATLQRYMQQSYHSMRPIHVVAAYSWVTMVPMTAFYYGFKLKEFYRGMDDTAVEALVRIGHVPTEQFNLFLSMLSNLLSDESKKEFLHFRDQVESQYGHLLDDNTDLHPPKVLDINDFAIDYYNSIAKTVRKFREENNIPIDTISRVLGLSNYQYSMLEKPNKIIHFPVSIGFRIKLGFTLTTHVYFTSEMKQFPEFHQLRQVQHVKDLLIVDALSRLDDEQRKSMTAILINLSNIYGKNVI